MGIARHRRHGIDLRVCRMACCSIETLRSYSTEATAAGAMLPVGGLIVGLVFGNVNTNLGGTLEMGPFQAARPMTSPDMSRTTLRAAGVSVLIAWAIWAAAYLALYAITSFGEHSSQVAVFLRSRGGFSR